MNERRVLVDTSVWINYFSGHAVTIRQLDQLLDSERVVISGQIKQEVLQGSRDAKAFTRLEQEMSLWAYEAEQPVDFLVAARIFARLRWQGKTIPPSDCLIAALAQRCDLEVFADDSHFDKITDLHVYQPSTQ